MQSCKEKILVHACCAPCSTHVINMLSPFYAVTALFYNPNIQPEAEYTRRLKDMEKLCELTKTELLAGNYDDALWNDRIKGMEEIPEGGIRCSACFNIRLEKTAETATSNGFKIFTTTLTVSPHKNAHVINNVGTKISEKAGILFLENDFKKKDGYKKSCVLSREYNLYRQNYCGCPFSNKQEKI